MTKGGAIYAYNEHTQECTFTPNGSNISMLIQLLLFIAIFGLGSCYYALVTSDCPFPSLIAFEIDFNPLFCSNHLLTSCIDLYSARKLISKNPAVFSAFMVIHALFVHVSDAYCMYCLRLLQVPSQILLFGKFYQHLVMYLSMKSETTNCDAVLNWERLFTYNVILKLCKL